MNGVVVGLLYLPPVQSSALVIGRSENRKGVSRQQYISRRQEWFGGVMGFASNGVCVGGQCAAVHAVGHHLRHVVLMCAQHTL